MTIPDSGRDRASAADWSLFAVAGLAVALNPLNSTMVAVALPSISGAFGADPAALTTWLVNGFLVVTIVCLAPAGKLADIFGHRRVLLTGQIVLLIGSALAFAAPDFAVLVVGRLLMASATAMLNPTGMAMVRNNVAPAHQARAFGIIAATNSVAATIGPALAGFMTEHWGWRTVFLVNVPLILMSWACQVRDRGRGRADTRAGRRPRFDWQGSLLLMASLLLVIGALRLLDATAIVLLAGGLVLSAGFVLWERRNAEPVVNFALFVRPGFTAGTAVLAAQFFGMYGLIFLSPFLFKLVAGFGPTEFGVFLMVFSATIIVAAPLAGWIADRIGARATVFAGGLTGAAGLLLLNSEIAWGSFLVICGGFALGGVGYGLSIGPAQAVALAAANPRESGAAAAALGTVRYIGGIVGIATLSALLADASPPEILGNYRLALWLFAGAWVLSAVIATALPRQPGTALRERER